MMEQDRAERVEEEYGMPPGRLMYHLYHEQEMSSGDIASEMGERRSTVKYWLQRSGIKLRSRTLTDTQKILIIAYLSAGVGRGTIADKVGCGNSTVYRYRKEIESYSKPVDIEADLSSREWDILSDIIEADITRESCAESTSETTSDSQ